MTVANNRNVENSALASEPSVEREVVYADSRPALTEAYRRGLSDRVVVRTNAPAILFDPAFESEPADELFSPESIRALEQGIYASSKIVYDEISTEYRGPLETEDVALVAARTVSADMQDFLFPALTLRECDFKNPPAIVTPRHPREDQRRWFHAGIVRSLGSAALERLVEIPSDALPAVDSPVPDDPSIWFRLPHLRGEAYRFRLGLLFWENLRAFDGKGAFLVYRDNELLRDAAAALLAKGYAVRRLRDVPPAGNAGPVDDSTVEAIVRDTLASSLPATLGPSVRDTLVEMTTVRCRENLGVYRDATPKWEEIFRCSPQNATKGVLTNMALGPLNTALHRVLKRQVIPIFGFQHGVTAEIGARQAANEFIHEPTWCDEVLSFNPEMANYCEKSPYGTKKSTVVGTPMVYHRLKRKQSPSRPSGKPLWYISTTIYHGNVGRLHRGLSDRDMCQRELALIDRVFSRLPCNMVYKPYPAFRYVDEDPILVRAEECGNIDVYKYGIDFRYLASKARMLVTTGATSTVSWCLMTDLPLVFIDDPNYMPLSESARVKFETGVFFFDGSDPELHEKLLTLLSQPEDEIEKQWEDRADARLRLVRQFVTIDGMDAGKRAAEAIENSIG